MPGVAQRVGRALLFHDRGTRRRWVVSSTPRLHFTPGKDPVRIVQEVGWAPGPVWTGGKSLPHRDSILDRPARSQSLYRLSYSAYTRSKADANSSERKKIACSVSSAYATTSQMLAAASRMFSYLYSTTFCGIGGERTTDVCSGDGAA